MLKPNKLFILVLTGVVMAGLAGCDFLFHDSDDDPAEDHSAEYDVPLSGANEVPPVETDASGEALLSVNEAGTAVHYQLSVSTIDSVTAAHIHVGSADENGGVVAFLFDGPTTSVGAGSQQIAEGTVTEADLIGPLEGAPFQELLQAMKDGNAYVNVHTTANPAGEIRGQINDPDGGGESSMTFTVTVKEKTEEHPHFGEGFPEGFVVDGEQGKALTLTRGETYTFQMEDVPSLHPFYLTTDERGLGSGEITEGASDNQQLTFTPTASTPNTIYYNCVNHAFMGYRITIE